MSIAARVAAPVMNSIFIRLERQDRQLAPQTPPPSAANEAPVLFQQSRGFGDQLLHLGASAPKMAPSFKDCNYAAGISIRSPRCRRSCVRVPRKSDRRAAIEIRGRLQRLSRQIAPLENRITGVERTYSHNHRKSRFGIAGAMSRYENANDLGVNRDA